MDSLKKHLTHWSFFRDLSPTYSSNEIYESVPSHDHEGNPTWRRRASSTGQGDVQIPNGTALDDLSLPRDRFLMRNLESHTTSSFTAGLFTTSMLMNVLRFLRPSFLPSRHSASTKPFKMLPTTYLNGVRGFAAVCVYFQHYLVKYFKFLDKGYLSEPDQNRILQLPFVRLLFTGRFMVANFFILSGFVLAMKPLRLIRKKDAALLDCLASSVFRRAPRLFLPLIPPMIFTAFINYNNWYYPQPEAPAVDPKQVYPPLAHRLNDEFGYYMDLLNPFTWGTAHPRDTPHMWTLPMEFRGSMVVFLSLLCLSRSKAAIRVSTLTGLAWYCIQQSHWDTFLFVCGILLAEVHLIKKEAGVEDLLQFLTKQSTKTTTLIQRTFWSSVFIFGLFLGSWPCEKAAVTPGLVRTLDAFTPHHYGNSEEMRGYFWYSIGAILIMLSFENFPVLQTPFCTPLARYLGDISFSFYIIHWTFLWTVGRLITNQTIALLGGSRHWGFFVASFIVVPATVCIADVYWRTFDNGSVNFARWMWVKCSDSEPAQRGEPIGNAN